MNSSVEDIRYPVNDCYLCVQGEGVQTGVAMVLLRLHGCAVGCPWCDTKHTWYVEPNKRVGTLDEALGENTRYAELTAHQLRTYIETFRRGPRWILVTGGEPAQYPLKPLVEELHRANYKVALETSGTEIGHLGAGFDWVCVSPKLNMPGGKSVQLATLETADEIKHVVGRQQDIDNLDGLLSQVKLKNSTQICLQPISQNQKATDLCIQTVQQRGWRLSVQMHKYINQP